MRDILLFHWSPTTRRKQIIRYGLRPHSRPTLSTQWKPPYICLADSPSWAWVLSGNIRTDIEMWDLWMVWLSKLTDVTRLKGAPPRKVHEYRSYTRIYKRDVWYVATRTSTKGMKDARGQDC